MGASGDDWDEEYLDEPSGGGIFTRTLRNVGLVVIVCAVLVAVFNTGDEADEGSSARTTPPSESVSKQTKRQMVQSAGTEVMLRADASGHFMVNADVNGTRIRFLVDTGASTVALSPADAERLGYDLQALEFSDVYQTANGSIRVAPVRLRRMRIGAIELDDVRASVNRAPMDISLLGMSFLGRLESYEIRGDRLVMAW